MENKIKSIAFLGNYLPRKCGIATFTTDLARSCSENFPAMNVFSIAMTNTPEGYDYPPMVKFDIRDHNISDYKRAADLINSSEVDILCVQHEYGIFGGSWGRYALTLLRAVKKPIVTTLHTVLNKEFSEQKVFKVFEEIVAVSSKLVVMSKQAVSMLKESGVPEEKIVMIPHGIPDIPFVDPNFYKDKFNVMGKKLILTFGLLGPDKGIEYMINAMPKIIEKHPDTMYIVLGATHPDIIRHQGEEYRLSLQRTVERLKLKNKVKFHDRFVTLDELCKYLCAADIYVTPYLKEQQITSGTLAYACGTGKAVVSTPYWYAKELLDENRGRIVPFRDSDAIANQIIELFDNEIERHTIRKNAYQFGRHMVWNNVAQEYINVFNQVKNEWSKRTIELPKHKQLSATNVPEVNMSQLKSLTTPFGILQHAKFTIPDFKHGYCLDDNARAMIVATKYYKLYDDVSMLDLMKKYLGFIMNSQKDDGNFINFYDISMTPLDKNETISDDCFGRAIWSLGYVVATGPDYFWVIAKAQFEKALKHIGDFSLRGLAYTILGLYYYLQRYPGGNAEKTLLQQLTKKIVDLYKQNRTDSWHWFEDKLTYANGVIPSALWMAGSLFKDDELKSIAQESTDFLFKICTRNDMLSLVGSNGWMGKDDKEKAHFDQQSIDACWMVTAARWAYTGTKDKKYLEFLETSVNWYFGYNDIGVPLYDHVTGGCYDGLEPTGANLNQGAESTICFLLALMTYNEISIIQDEEDLLSLTPKYTSV